MQIWIFDLPRSAAPNRKLIIQAVGDEASDELLSEADVFNYVIPALKNAETIIPGDHITVSTLDRDVLLDEIVT